MDYPQDSRDLPYPNLIDAYSRDRQEDYFMEPAILPSMPGDNLHKTKHDNRIEKEVRVHFPEFGSLTHTYRRQRPGQAPEEVMFFRRDRGTIDHGLGRKDEELYECAKFNKLRHIQRSNGNNSDSEASNTDRIHDYNKDMLKLVNYPYLEETVMSAPLLPRRGPNRGLQDSVEIGQFKRPMRKQPEAFSEVFATPELRMMILKHLGHRWGDLSNLSRTCQFALFTINDATCHVDATSGNFLNMQMPSQDIDKITKAASHDAAATAGKIFKPGNTDFLVISHIRGPYIEAPNGEQGPRDDGRPTPARGHYWRPSFEERVASVYELFRTLNARGPELTVLHLHSIQNVDITVLEMCLDSLPNLEALGVYNCELLDFGATVPFLNMVIAHNKKPGNTKLLADFSPYYYKGIDQEYGVMASNTGAIFTRPAVTAVLRTAVSLALDNDIDWFSAGTGMRQFLERIPWALGTPRYILEALYNLHYFERAFLRHPPLDGADRSRKKMMWRTIINDLVLAVYGKSMARNDLNVTVFPGGSVNLLKCVVCSVELPVFFFRSSYSARWGGRKECDGCKLCRYLSNQIDNYLKEKRRIPYILFRGLPADMSIRGLLSAKRIAADFELLNPAYPFWQVSVKSPQEVQAASLANGIPLILDGRPSPNQSDEVKEIWDGLDRIFRAKYHSFHYIEMGRARHMPRINDLIYEIALLDDLDSKGLSTQQLIIENATQRESLRQQLLDEYARIGEKQREGTWGNTERAEWGEEISNYHEKAQLLSPALQSQD
ncbi:hypothetical protein F4806DRAFT_496733 [Annulohypoxylon nitens]|nr:hypothetical protein F4806DRAFT_496733 [Annulohypoxylon nitens]